MGVDAKFVTEPLDRGFQLWIDRNLRDADRRVVRRVEAQDARRFLRGSTLRGQQHGGIKPESRIAGSPNKQTALPEQTGGLGEMAQPDLYRRQRIERVQFRFSRPQAVNDPERP